MAEKSSKLSALGQVAIAILGGFSGAFFERVMLPPPPPPASQVASTRASKIFDSLFSSQKSFLTEPPAGKPPEGTYRISFLSGGKEASVTVRVPDYRVIGTTVPATPLADGGYTGPHFTLEYASSSKDAPVRLQLDRERMRHLLADLEIDKDVQEHMESVEEVRIVRTDGGSEMSASAPAPERAQLKEKKAVPAIELIASVVTAIELLSKVPKVAAAIKRLGINMSALFQAKGQAPPSPPPPKSPLDTIIDQERRKLDKAIEDYYALDSREQYDEIEKDKYRRRIAARTCSLLKAAVPIKDRIPDYEKLIALFCTSIPEALAA